MSQPEMQGLEMYVTHHGEDVDDDEDPDGMKNLIVNYLPISVKENDLAQIFCEIGELSSVRIITDKKTKRSKGYGFVKFKDAMAAAEAIKKLNGKSIHSKRLKVAYARPGGPRAKANLFVGNIPKTWNDEEFVDHFRTFGPIIESRVLRNPDGESRRCGFVRLDTIQAAEKAIAELDGWVPRGQFHGIHVKIAERPDAAKAALYQRKLQAQNQEMQMEGNYNQMNDFPPYMQQPVQQPRHFPGASPQIQANYSAFSQGLPQFTPDFGPSYESYMNPVMSPNPGYYGMPMGPDPYLGRVSSHNSMFGYQSGYNSPMDYGLIGSSMPPPMMRDQPRPSEILESKARGHEQKGRYGNRRNKILVKKDPTLKKGRHINLGRVKLNDLKRKTFSLPLLDEDTADAFQQKFEKQEKYHRRLKKGQRVESSAQFSESIISLESKNEEQDSPNLSLEGSQTKKRAPVYFKKTESEQLLEEQGLTSEDKQLPLELKSFDMEETFQISVTKATDQQEGSEVESPLADHEISNRLQHEAGDERDKLPSLQINPNLQHPVTPPQYTTIIATTPPAIVLTTPPIASQGNTSSIPYFGGLSTSPVGIRVPNILVASPNSYLDNAVAAVSAYYPTSPQGSVDAGFVNRIPSFGAPHSPTPTVDNLLAGATNPPMNSGSEFDANGPASVTKHVTNVAEDTKHGHHHCLFIYNIPPFFDESHLRNLFSQYGPVKYTRVHRHKDGTSKGFGFVNYYTSESSRRAVKELNGKSFYNKKLQVRLKDG